MKRSRPYIMITLIFSLGFFPARLAHSNECIEALEVQPENPIQRASFLAEEKLRFQKKIQFWQEVARRDVSLRRARRFEATSRVDDSIAIDHPNFTADILINSVIYEVDLLFHQVLRHRGVLRRISRFVKELNNENPDLKKLESHLKFFEKSGEFDRLSKVRALVKERQFQQAAVTFERMGLNEGNILKKMMTLNLRVEEYSATKGTLAEYAEGTGEMAENARTVLGKLQSKYVLDSYAIGIGNKNLKTPTMKDIRGLIDLYPEAEVMALRAERTMEMWSAIAAKMPDKYLHRMIDKVLRRVPWLRHFNSPYGVIEETRLRFSYFFKIDRIDFAEGSDWARLRALEIFNSTSTNDNEFLVTFARRIDVRETWELLMELANKDKGSKIAIRMAEAESYIKKENLRDLSPWHVPKKSGLTRFWVSAAFGGASYGVYYALEHLQGWYYQDKKTTEAPSDKDSDIDAASAAIKEHLSK